MLPGLHYRAREEWTGQLGRGRCGDDGELMVIVVVGGGGDDGGGVVVVVVVVVVIVVVAAVVVVVVDVAMGGSYCLFVCLFVVVL